MEGLLRGSGPKLKLVAAAVATMAHVAADGQVHGERAAAARRLGLIQRTTSVRLSPRSIRRLEPKQAQNLLHRDIGANAVEVDARHGSSSFGDTTAQYSFDRSVPTLSIGERERPPVAQCFLLQVSARGRTCRSEPIK
jgi:uncharacterized protein with von Willebrand factor type A (vWA) domain